MGGKILIIESAYETSPSLVTKVREHCVSFAQAPDKKQNYNSFHMSKNDKEMERAKERYLKARADIQRTAQKAKERAQKQSVIETLERKFERYKWLNGIAKMYQEHIELIEREKDYYTVYQISFSARGETTNFLLNPHRSINPKYILAGLRDALKRVNIEIAECEKHLFEVEDDQRAND